MSNLKRYITMLNPIGLCLMLFLGFMISVKGVEARTFQQIKVKGRVISANTGTPLAGVSVTDIANPSNGTITDENGDYQIDLPSDESSLRFSHLSFTTKELIVKGRAVVNVSLDEDASILDQVVVVGYGTQKKINQTGATQTVRFNGPVNTPVTNTAQLMYGKFSGVQITQGSGLPGNDGSSIVIRGVGTFGNSTPLVVIDNIQYFGDLSAFNALAPSDIASISVLKGAAASAIYGARGANGVILITTKQGKSGAMSISYNSYIGTQSPTVIPKFLDAVDYATLRNEYDVNTNGSNAPLRYSPANIQAIANGSEPDMYANTDWAKVLLTNAPIQNQYLSFSGGNEKTTFRLSLGYLNQDAIVKSKYKSQRYNFSLNINSKVKSWLTVNNVLSSYWQKFNGPTGGASAITGQNGIINQMQWSAPTVPAYYSNGMYGIVDGSYQNVNFSYPIINGLMRGQLGNYVQNTINIANRLGLLVQLSKDLSFETSGSINLNTNNNSDFNPTNSTYDYDGNLINQNLINSLSQNSSFNYNLTTENILRYNKSFNEKNVLSVLVGQSAIYDRTSTFGGSLQSFPTNNYYQFDAGGVLNPNVTGNAAEESIQSFFSRMTYAYDGKYLFEVNARRDGSSKFGPSHRYANFPSASAGWLMNKENFLKNVNWLSELKLRGSWGITGNDNIGNYIYDQSLNSNLTYILGSEVVTGAVAVTALGNPSVTWETVKQYDLGVDAAFFKNSLSFTADYFKKNSSNVLYDNFPIPSSIGVTNLGAENAASMTNGGLELSLNYTGTVMGINYNIGGSISKYANNNVTSLGATGVKTINGATIVEVGAPFQAYYGYKVKGIFQTQADVANAPVQFGDTKTAPGDFQYEDISGPNGVPDSVIDANDRTVIGNPYPKMVYNFHGGLNYKGFDLNALFQGIHGIDRLLQGNGELPFSDNRSNALSYWINRWTPTNPSTILPRVGGQNNSVVSDFYVQDASYLRLKNLELGYTLPTLFTQKYGITSLRLYASAQNILTIAKMKNFDPERAAGTASDLNAPLYKIYTVGLNLKF